MFSHVQFDAALIQRYDRTGPRYTSYPTAVSFTEDFSEAAYREAAANSNADPIPGPLSLYFHIPFCDTVCFYCACNKKVTKNHSLAEEYLSRLYQEIQMQSALYDNDRVVEQLHWGGGTPTFLSKNEMAELMAQTRRHFTLRDDDQGDYSIEIDPRSVDEAAIQHLRSLGFNRFSLGVQDVNPKVQKAVNRIQPLEQNRRVIQACRESGAKSINVDLIYGLPFQSTASFCETLDAVIDLSPDRVSVFNYAHMPHLFKPQRRISEDDLPSPGEKLEILRETIDKFLSAGYVYVGMDHFAKPDDELVLAQQAGTLQRNFQGYTTHDDCDLVAMGVSAISKVHDVYSQNDKMLDGYYQAIDAGHLPVVKGVQLNFDDLIRRDLIQQLICNFKLDRQAFADDYCIDFPDYFSEELRLLRPFADDGLVRVSEQAIEILPRGRLLVRNICMVFDVSLRKIQLATRFSRVV